MAQNISSLTYQAISPTNNSSVANITLDPNIDLVWNVRVLGNVQDTARNVQPKWISIDNTLANTGITISIANFTYRTPAYTRETFAVPDGIQQISFTFDNGSTTAVKAYLSEDRIADNINDQLKSQQEAAKTLVYSYVTVTANGNQQITDGNQTVLFKPIVSAINYNLLDIAGAGVGNGFLSFVKNLGNFPVSLNPFGAQTINGVYNAATPIVMQPGDSGILSSDGTNWYYQGKISYQSAQQAIVLGGQIILPHGLAIKPLVYGPYLINFNAEGGYNAGDEINIDPHMMASTGTNNSGVSLVPDATNLTVRFGSSAFTLLAKGSGVAFTATTANWRFVAKAFVIW